jgi:hypothetical protein
MNNTTVVLVLAGSNLACLALGYLFGRLTLATVHIEENMATDQEETSQERSARRGVNATQVIAWTMAVMGIAMIALGTVVIRNQSQLAGCVRGYSDALADSLDARAAPQQTATDQLDKVMEAIIDAYDDIPADGRAKVQAAIQDYVKARKAARETLADHPLPAAPRDACADLLN